MYLDSAILVKLVIREPDSDFYMNMTDGQSDVHSSELAVVECRSALLRKRREKEIDDGIYEGAWQRLCALWTTGGLTLQPVTRGIMEEAGEIMEKCLDKVPLRSLDAIHLASCLQLRTDVLVSNDRTMRAAAKALAIPVNPLS